MIRCNHEFKSFKFPCGEIQVQLLEVKPAVVAVITFEFESTKEQTLAEIRNKLNEK